VRLYNLNYLEKRWSLELIKLQRVEKDRLHQFIWYFFITEFWNRDDLVEHRIENVFLCFICLFSFERIFLYQHIIDTTTKAPHIHFFRKVVFFENELRAGVVDVTWKIVSFQKFLEVEGQTYGVKFNMCCWVKDSVLALVGKALDSTGMHIPMNNVMVMKRL
jgi:hypothetical protein